MAEEMMNLKRARVPIQVGSLDLHADEELECDIDLVNDCQDSHCDSDDGNHMDLQQDEEEGLEDLDLKEYFKYFGLNDFQQISVCRTYANHLAAKLPKRGPAKKLKRSMTNVHWKRQ